MRLVVSAATEGIPRVRVKTLLVFPVDQLDVADRLLGNGASSISVQSVGQMKKPESRYPSSSNLSVSDH